MKLKLALLLSAWGSGNSMQRFVETGHGIRSLSVNMSPMRQATSQGAHRVGRLRTEKHRTSKITGKISPISGGPSTNLPLGPNQNGRGTDRSRVGKNLENTMGPAKI